jgi:hypothetical protein
MPKPRPRRRSSSRKSASRALREMRSQLLDIEAPLRDATHYVQALQFIGAGLIAENDDAGEPVAAVASAAAERLETVREIWGRIHESGRRPGPDKRRRKRA